MAEPDNNEERIRRLEAVVFAHQHLIVGLLAGRITPNQADELLWQSDLAKGGPEGPAILSFYRNEIEKIASKAHNRVKRQPINPILRWLIDSSRASNRIEADPGYRY